MIVYEIMIEIVNVIVLLDDWTESELGSVHDSRNLRSLVYMYPFVLSIRI